MGGVKQVDTKSEATQSSLVNVLGQHVVRLFTFRHKGEGLQVNSRGWFFAILMAPLFTAFLLHPDSFEVALRAGLMVILYVLHPRYRAVGVALIFLVTDAGALLAALMGSSHIEALIPVWSGMAVLVFLFTKPLEQKT